MFQHFSIFFLLLMSCSAELYPARNDTNYMAAYNRAAKSLIVNWINELPNYELDLKEYKDALNNILFFFKDYRKDIDVSAAMGLRLIRVNFKHALEHMGTKLSVVDRGYIKNVIDRTENLIQYFKITSANTHLKYKKIAAVITATDRPWLERMKQYDMDLFKLNTERSLSMNWETYKTKITEVNKTVPSPMLSDMCLTALAEDLPFDSSFPQECRMPLVCKDSLLKGTDYGYALAHRILMLIFANFGRNCNIISWKDDGTLIEKFCQLAKRECEYMVGNKYGAPDLLMEFTALCSMEGFTQFMKRSWFHQLLRLQTSHGCFMESFERPIPTASRKHGRKYVRGNRVQVGNCNKHSTVVASVTLAAAIRFILESYY